VALQALVQPLKLFGSTHRVWRYIVSAWTLAAVFAIPQLIFFVHHSPAASPAAPLFNSTVITQSTPSANVVYKCESGADIPDWIKKLYSAFLACSLLQVWPPTAS